MRRPLKTTEPNIFQYLNSDRAGGGARQREGAAFVQVGPSMAEFDSERLRPTINLSVATAGYNMLD